MTFTCGIGVRRATREPLTLRDRLAVDFETLPYVLLVRLSKTPPGTCRCRMLLVAVVKTLLDLAAKGVKKVTLCLEDHERSSIKIGVRGGNDGSARALEYAVVLSQLLRIVTAASDGTFPVVELRQGPEGEVGACVEIRILRRVRPESPRRPPRHRRDACLMAWRCRVLTARWSQRAHVIAEK